MRTIIIMSLAVLCSLATNGLAQDSIEIEEIETAPLDTDLILEPSEKVSDPDLKMDGKYSSEAVGKRKRWQLDSGEFDLDSTTPKPRRNSGDGDGYSGFRLRLPTKPK